MTSRSRNRYAEILRKEGQRPAAMLSYLAFLLRESNTKRSAAAVAGLINSMQAPKAGDPAPVVVTALGDDVSKGLTGLQFAHVVAKLTRTEDDKLQEPLGENIASALARYIALASNIEFEDTSDPIADVILPSVTRITQANVAQEMAWFVVSLARVPGASEWLEANPQARERLAEVLGP
ncbi:MAG: hypothetical protein AAF184_23125 [Pseudomonadota bacterium]